MKTSQVENIFSVEDYLKFKKQLNINTEDEQDIQKSKAMQPNAQSRVMNQSKMMNSKMSRMTYGEQSKYYPMYQTMHRDNQSFDNEPQVDDQYLLQEIDRTQHYEMAQNNNEKEKYFRENQKYREQIISDTGEYDKYDDQIKKFNMNQREDRIVTNLLKEVSDLMQRANSSKVGHQNKITDYASDLIGNMMNRNEMSMLPIRPDQQTNYISNDDIRNYLDAIDRTTLKDPNKPQPSKPRIYQQNNNNNNQQQQQQQYQLAISKVEQEESVPNFRKMIEEQTKIQQQSSGKQKKVMFQDQIEQDDKQGGMYDQIVKRAQMHNQLVYEQQMISQNQQQKLQQQQQMVQQQQMFIQSQLQQQNEQQIMNRPTNNQQLDGSLNNQLQNISANRSLNQQINQQSTNQQINQQLDRELKESPMKQSPVKDENDDMDGIENIADDIYELANKPIISSRQMLSQGPSQKQIKNIVYNQKEKLQNGLKVQDEDEYLQNKYNQRLKDVMIEMGDSNYKKRIKSEYEFLNLVKTFNSQIDQNAMVNGIMEQLDSIPNNDLKIDALNQNVSKVMFKLNIKYQTLLQNESSQDLYKYMIYYISILLDALQLMLWQNQDIRELYTVLQDLLMIKNKLIGLDKELFAYFIRMTEVAFENGNHKFKILKDSLERMDVVTDKTLINQNNIIIDHQVAKQFEVESQKSNYMNKSHVDSHKK